MLTAKLSETFALKSDPPIRWDADAKRLFSLSLFLMMVGVVVAASASMGPSSLYTGGHTEFHFLIRHSIYVLMGVTAMAAVYRVPIELWQKFSSVLLV